MLPHAKYLPEAMMLFGGAGASHVSSSESLAATISAIETSIATAGVGMMIATMRRSATPVAAARPACLRAVRPARSSSIAPLGMVGKVFERNAA